MSARRDRQQVRQIKLCVKGGRGGGGGGNTSLINAAHALAQEAAGLAKSQPQEVQHLAGGAENWVKEKSSSGTTGSPELVHDCPRGQRRLRGQNSTFFTSN